VDEVGEDHDDPEGPEAPLLPVWTVGHSNGTLDDLIERLHGAGIKVVADVRSVPHSRFVPWFDRDALKEALAEDGLGYVYLGGELGGRASAAQDIRAAAEAFQAGLDRLVGGVRDHTVAVMCAEEDPSQCHRRHLLTPALEARGCEVRHLRGDGSIVTEAELQAEEGGEQLGLFS
jgi:uncharacterized protein (DUF488 family)